MCDAQKLADVWFWIINYHVRDSLEDAFVMDVYHVVLPSSRLLYATPLGL
jgi:hypothetical protein